MTGGEERRGEERRGDGGRGEHGMLVVETWRLGDLETWRLRDLVRAVPFFVMEIGNR